MSFQVAFTGIDGAGKTTLVQSLLRIPEFLDVRYCKKTKSRDVHQLQTHFHIYAEQPRLYTATSVYARSLSWATYFDFVEYWHNDISKVWHCDEGVFLDRWTPCVASFCSMAADIGSDINDLLRDFPKPTARIHLRIEPSVALERIKARGTVKADEALPILEALHEAYERDLQSSDSTLLVLDEGRLEDNQLLTRAFLDRTLNV